MRSHRARFLCLGAAACTAAALAAGCSSSGSSSPSSSPTIATKTPIVIGASLSLTGDFAGDGQNFKKGYQLWVSDVNAAGGLLGRPVQLKILNDASSPTQVVTNYDKLISTDHVDLTFGPFSSLLTTPASAVAARNGLAFNEGAGGAPNVLTTPANQSPHHLFYVNLPCGACLGPFAES